MSGLSRITDLACAGIVAAAPLLYAHAAATQQPAQSPAQNSDGTATVRTNANLVLVDVVVTNRGTPVHGLKQSQVHVLEDGREQTITTFDEHQPPAAASATIAPPTLPPRTFTNVPSWPAGSSVNVLLLDALNTPIESQMNVRQQMLQYLGKIPPGTQLSIFTLSSRLRMIAGFTADPADLIKALQGAKKTSNPSGSASPQALPQSSVVLDTQTDQDLDSTIGDMANMAMGTSVPTVAGVSPLGEMQQFIADVGAYQTDLRVRMTMDAMQQLARYLSGIPGRKNLLWFSGSFPIALEPDDSMDDPFEAMRSYSSEITETSKLLTSARVAVYPIDARGLMTPPTLDASYTKQTNLVGATAGGSRNAARARATANKPSVSADDLKRQKQLMEEQASMQQIAQETGGHEYLNTNGLQDAISSAIENGSSYYTVGYVPATSPSDGRFHKIQVRVENSDFKLAYRNGYYADSADKNGAHAVGNSLIRAATLHGAPPSTQILFQALVRAAGDPALQGTKLPAGTGGEMVSTFKGPVQRQYVDLDVDLRTLSYGPSASGAQSAQVEFTLVAYDRDGNRCNYLDTGFQLALKPGQFQQPMATSARMRFPFDLPAGVYSLRIAVHDLTAGRVGSLEFPVRVTVP